MSEGIRTEPSLVPTRANTGVAATGASMEASANAAGERGTSQNGAMANAESSSAPQAGIEGNAQGQSREDSVPPSEPKVDDQETTQQNAPPEAVNDVFNFAQATSYQTTGGGLLANDQANGALVGSTLTTLRGGSVTLAADGNFQFVPRSSVFWGDDSFEYTLTNEAGSSTASVRLRIQPMGTLQLSDLEIGGNGFAVRTDALGGFAESVANAGDVNADGFDDIIIGLPSSSGNNINNSGAAFVVFGSAAQNALSFPLSALNPQLGFQIEGATVGELVGAAVAGVGDVNSDGFDDVILGAPGSETGGAYVVYGSAQPGNVSLDLLPNDALGFYIAGEDPGDNAGARVGAAGDVNGDGRPDILVGALDRVVGDDFGSRTYVVYGGANPSRQALGNLTVGTGFTIDSLEGFESVRSNLSIAGAKDFNGDGIDDIAVAGGGRVAIVYGSPNNTPVFLETLPSNRGTTLSAGNEYALLEAQVAGAGDTNGDGFADLLLTAGQLNQNGDQDLRGAYVLFGRSGPATFTLETLNPSDGYKLGMADLFPECSEATFSAGGGGDTNGDGLADFLVSMWPEGTCGSEVVQRAFSFQGTATPASKALSTLVNTEGHSLVAPNPRGVDEVYVSTAGDVNGDGLADSVVLVQGTAFVLFGWTTASSPATN